MKWTEKKPFYFCWVVVSWIIVKILDMIAEAYMGEEVFKKILLYSITVRQALPWLVACITFIVCCAVYAYGRIKNNFRVVLKENQDGITKYINKLIEDEYVESAQAYKYTVCNDNDFKYIKFGFLYGKVVERLDVNVILQTYFFIPHSIYKKMQSAAKLYQQYVNDPDPNTNLDALYAFKEKGTELCQNLMQRLNEIKCVSEITEIHYSMYRILAVMMPAVNDETPVAAFLKNQEIEQALISKKKTGLLGGLILKNCHVFRNEGSLTKKNRIYVTFPFAQENNVLILVSINSQAFQNPHDSDIAKYCTKLFEHAYE